MYSSTIKPTRNDLRGKGKQWKGEIGAMETVVAGLIASDSAQHAAGKTFSSKCWAISFTTDWVVIVMCDGDPNSLLSYVAARRAENIGMSVLEYVESHSSAQTMNLHLASYLASDGILAMNVSKLAKDEIQNGGGADTARQQSYVRGELFGLHKDGLQMGIGVVCIDRTTHQAVVWKCGDIDVLYRSTASESLQSLFAVNSNSWSNKYGLQGEAQFLMCTDVAQMSMRTSSAANVDSVVGQTEVPDDEFQDIRVEDDIAWVTWCVNTSGNEPLDTYSVSSTADEHFEPQNSGATLNKSPHSPEVEPENNPSVSNEQVASNTPFAKISDSSDEPDTAGAAPEHPVEVMEQQALQGREFTRNVRLAEENSHGFFYLGNKYISIHELKMIFRDEAFSADIKGLSFENCAFIDDACIEFLSELKYIRHLDLRNTAVTIKSLYFFSKFKNLKYLDLSKTNIRTEDIAGVSFPKGMRLKIDA